MKVLSFTNLYPNAIQPNLGVFVRERLRRLRNELHWEHRVIAPLPFFPPIPGFGRWSEQGKVPRRELDDGVEVLHPRYLKLPGLGLEGQARAMAKGIRKTFEKVVSELRPDVIDAHYLYPDCVAAQILASEQGIPLIASARGSDVNVLAKHEGPRAQIQELLRHARFVCGVSEALCEKLRALEPSAAAKIVHAPNGVDLEKFSPGPQAAARQKVGLADKGRWLLFVGRLVRAKGVHELLEALAALPSEVSLCYVGKGEERGALEARAKELRLEERVHFAGEVAHAALVPWYRAADRFVLPSYSEGHPNVVCEALACGLPVVASAVGGVPEIAKSEVSDLFAVDPDDPARDMLPGLRMALQRSLQRSFSPAALVEARRRLGWEPTIATLRSVFERAVS
ncbi:MAG: glycosyltransferase [Planctomycetes bacterium]|nr:glycosyltransferase [Planctomycetota bacterium]